MKILVTADWQLGAKRFPRTNDFNIVLDQVADIAVANKDNLLVVVSGDIFDSYDVPASSGKAFRKFCDRMEKEKILTICLEGNHEHDKSGKSDKLTSRIRQHSDWPLRPDRQTGIVPMPDGWTWDLKVAGFDWMPRTIIAEKLETLPEDLDILCLHQSLGGLVPNISAEVTKEQIADKASIVCIGDIHVPSEIPTARGYIISPGSTERCAVSEPAQKSVTLVTYDHKLKVVTKVERIPLKTRMIIAETVSTAEDINRITKLVHENIANQPLVHVSYLIEFKRIVEEESKAWREMGLMIELAPVADTFDDKAEEQEGLRNEASVDREMEELLKARHKDPREQILVVDLWKNPERIDEILEIAFRQASGEKQLSLALPEELPKEEPSIV